MKRTLITSALPYANGYLHLGHCAGVYLPADIYTRWLRLSGESALYVCGSDEHGVAITISAEKEKVAPKNIIDKYHNANMDAFRKFGMSFDIYSRTSLPTHHETALEFFADFLEKGFLVQREEEQFFDTSAKMFLPDRYVEGICPNCGSDKARGDQCDSCGAYYNQIELKNPISTVSGKPPIVKKTTHWYMRFDAFQEFLEGYVEGHSKDWKDNVLQQSRSWLKQGMAERAITRDLEWGVHIDKVKGIDKEKAKGKVLYVWFDAVLGYISATKEWAAQRAADHKGAPEDWKTWWQDEETRYCAFIGKDNIVFHTMIFPAMLKAKGGYILPDNVPANEFLNLEGQKFSKSRNWSIDLQDYIKNHPESNYIDALRYTLAMNFPETKDSDFTWKDLQARNNNELAAIFGNFINRTLQFAHKNFGGKVPGLSGKYTDLARAWNNLVDYFESATGKPEQEIMDGIPQKLKAALPANDLALIQALWNGARKASDLYSRFRFRDAITETMNIARAANKYFNDETPWKTVTSDPELCAKSIYFCVELVYSLSVLFAPIVPFAARRVQSLFEGEVYTGASNNAERGQNFWQLATCPMLEEGRKIMTPSIIFSKIEDDFVDREVAALGTKAEAAAAEEKKDELITYDEFMKVKLCTARVISAERIPKAEKLLKLTVNLGKETRQIVAGVAKHYEPDYLVGKVIVVVANLKPAKLMGLESQGMMLAASTEDGRLCFVTPENPAIGEGAEVR